MDQNQVHRRNDFFDRYGWWLTSLLFFALMLAAFKPGWLLVLSSGVIKVLAGGTAGLVLDRVNAPKSRPHTLGDNGVRLAHAEYRRAITQAACIIGLCLLN